VSAAAPGAVAAARVSMKRLRWPWLTLSLAGVTLAVVVAQLLHPALILAWQWEVARIAAGEWWRPVTGLLVHTGGWAQIVFNLLGLLVIGWLAEQGWSRLAWAIAALAGIVAAEIAAVWWLPAGGGISVVLGGLVGLTISGWAADRRLPVLFRLVLPLAYLAGAAYVCLLNDIHGPPVFAGALAGLALLHQRRPVSLLVSHG